MKTVAIFNQLYMYKGFSYCLVRKNGDRFWLLTFTAKKVELLVPKHIPTDAAEKILRSMFDKALTNHGLSRFSKKEFYPE